MFKKIFIIISLVLLLNSCFWKASEEKLEKNEKVAVNDNNDTSNNLATIAWNWFLIQLPKSLSKVNDIPTPRVWKVVLAMQSKEMINWFINNIVIIKQKLDKKMSSEEFSIVNQVKAKTKYTNYKKLQTKTFVFEDWDISVLYIFEARYNSNTTKQHFLQIWKVCNKTDAYIITIWLNKRIFDFEKYEKYIKTFKCKN